MTPVEVEIIGTYGSLFIGADGTWRYARDLDKIQAAGITQPEDRFRLAVVDTNNAIRTADHQY